MFFNLQTDVQHLAQSNLKGIVVAGVSFKSSGATIIVALGEIVSLTVISAWSMNSIELQENIYMSVTSNKIKGEDALQSKHSITHRQNQQRVHIPLLYYVRRSDYPFLQT